MKGALFLLAFGVVPFIGLAPLLTRRFEWITAGARLTLATAIGAVVLYTEMFALSVIGVSWSVPLLVVGPGLALGAVVARHERLPRRQPRHLSPMTPLSVALLLTVALAVVLVTYAAMTARVTSTDLLYFWGAKGERFGLSRGLDARWLSEHVYVNADYPPLWPCLYGFGTLFAGRLAWGATLATMPAFLCLSVVAVWSFARMRVGASEAAAHAAAYAAAFGFLLCVTLTAGNADAPLLFFETLALCLLVFAREQPGAYALAGIALAGAASMKLEGIVFSIAVIVACGLVLRPLRARHFVQLSAPPGLAVLSWVVFCRLNGIVNYLGPPKTLVLTGERVRTIARGMLSAARFESSYAPWILVALLLLLRHPTRTRYFALLVAGAVAAFDVGIYLTGAGDPTQWIGWSGARTLMTPVLALLMAALAPEKQEDHSEAQERLAPV